MAIARSRWPSILAAAGLGFAAVAVLAGSATAAEPVGSDRERQPSTETQGQAPPPRDLSDRLDRSKGVIQPPQTIDPQMQVPAPNPDPKSRVIPPPGSPGGDQSVEPK